MMKIFKQILLMTLLVVGFSMTAMAQRDDNQNRPKKDPSVEIVPADKDKPKDRPKDDGNNNNNNRPKKPRDSYLEGENIIEISSV